MRQVSYDTVLAREPPSQAEMDALWQELIDLRIDSLAEMTPQASSGLDGVTTEIIVQIGPRTFNGSVWESSGCDDAGSLVHRIAAIRSAFFKALGVWI